MVKRSDLLESVRKIFSVCLFHIVPLHLHQSLNGNLQLSRICF